MKKIIALLVAVVAVLSLSSCGKTGTEPSSGEIPIKENSPEVSVPDTSEPEVPEEPEDGADTIQYHETYYEFIDSMTSEGAICGCAHIAYTDDFEGMGYEFMIEVNGYSEFYPFVHDIPEERYFDLGGTELFCIVPVPGSEVELREWSVLNDSEQKGEVIYSSENGEPFMVLCNRDSNPDAEITVTSPDGQELSFHPYYMADIYDGDAFGYDFTIYDTFGEGDFLYAEDLIGEWEGISDIGDEEYILHLFIWNETDGSIGCNYWYETAGKKGYVNYVGNIRNETGPDGSNTGWIEFSLLNSDDENDLFSGNYLFRMNQFDAYIVYATHYDGNPFVPGMEYMTFEFDRVYG